MYRPPRPSSTAEARPFLQFRVVRPRVQPARLPAVRVRRLRRLLLRGAPHVPGPRLRQGRRRGPHRRRLPGLRRLHRADGAGAGRAGDPGRARAVAPLRPGEEAQAAVPRAAVQGGAHVLQHHPVQGLPPQCVPQASVPGGPRLPRERPGGREEGRRWTVRPRRADEARRTPAASGVRKEHQDLLRLDAAVAGRARRAAARAQDALVQPVQLLPLRKPTLVSPGVMAPRSPTDLLNGEQFHGDEAYIGAN